MLVKRFEKLAADGFMFMDVHTYFAIVSEHWFGGDLNMTGR